MMMKLFLLLAAVFVPLVVVVAEVETATTTNSLRHLKNNCDETCTDQGSCSESHKIEICHNGHTQCISVNGWNGHCGQSTCGACTDGEGGGSCDCDGCCIAARNCFAGTTMVTTVGGEQVAMKDLQIGDRILTSSGQYERVYGFGHYQPDRTVEMLEISTTNLKNPLQVTPDHLLKKKDSGFVPAGSIQVGDILETTAESEANVVVSQIQRVTPNAGLYAPLTSSGTLIVQGGIVASSYIALPKIEDSETLVVSHHDWVHFYLTPYRVFCLGVAPHLCHPKYYANNDGMPHYIDFGIRLLESVFASEDAVTIISKGFFFVVATPLVFILAILEEMMKLDLGIKLLIVAIVLALRRVVVFRTSTRNSSGSGQKVVA